MSKKERTKYTLAQKQEIVQKIEAAVAAGSNIKQACQQFDLHDGMYHKWKRAGIKPATEATTKTEPAKKGNPKFLSLEEKVKVIGEADALIAAGTSVKEAILKTGISQANFYAYKKQIAKHNGTLPAVVGAKTDLQMMQFDLGQAPKAPMVLMIGNAEDFKSTLATLGNFLRGN